VEAPELCDDGEENANSWSFTEHCNANCTGQAPYCGDGQVDEEDSELCDDGLGNNDVWEPLEHCNSTCSASAPLCDLPEDTSVTFPRPGVPYPAENLHTPEKAILGKVLFWGQQLSADDAVACGSCHQGSAGGSDTRAGLALHPGADGLDETGDDVHGSMGIRRCEMVAGLPVPKTDAIFGDKVQVTDRKTPSFLDAMFAPALFWDARATDVFVDPDTSTVAIVTGGALESQTLGPILSPCRDVLRRQNFQ
jgi:cytochrome c peroxidase